MYFVEAASFTQPLQFPNQSCHIRSATHVPNTLYYYTFQFLQLNTVRAFKTRLLDSFKHFLARGSRMPEV
jgi:hypothetical protein